MNSVYLEELNGILVGYANKRINNLEESEDIIQETLMKVFIKNIDFCCDKSMKKYIFGALNNALIDYYRKKKLEIDNDFDVEKVPTNCSCYIEQIDDYIFKFLDHLSESDKEILQFVDVEGKKVKDFSLEKDIPLETAKTRLKRARVKLKEKLYECCDFELDKNGKVINNIKKGTFLEC